MARTGKNPWGDEWLKPGTTGRDLLERYRALSEISDDFGGENRLKPLSVDERREMMKRAAQWGSRELPGETS
jgi:hypothetical protein